MVKICELLFGSFASCGCLASQFDDPIPNLDVKKRNDRMYIAVYPAYCVCLPWLKPVIWYFRIL